MNEILILKMLDAKDEATKLKRGIEVPTNLQRLDGPYERWPLNSPGIPLNRWACAHRSLFFYGHRGGGEQSPHLNFRFVYIWTGQKCPR
jgi:hypothetical protein